MTKAQIRQHKIGNARRREYILARTRRVKGDASLWNRYYGIGQRGKHGRFI